MMSARKKCSNTTEGPLFVDGPNDRSQQTHLSEMANLGAQNR